VTPERKAEAEQRRLLEQTFLGLSILRPEEFTGIAHRVNDNLFQSAVHRLLANALVALVPTKTWDYKTVAGWLLEHGQLEQAGGEQYIANLMDVITGDIGEYLRQLESFRAKDVLRQLAQSILKDAVTLPGEELLEQVESRIVAIHEQVRRGDDFVKFSDAVTKAMDVLEKRVIAGKPVTGVATGFADLDTHTSGLQPGDLIIVAGYPSRGKSILAEQMALHAAKNGYTTLFFSLEMTSQVVLDRAFSRVGGVPLWQIRTGRIPPEHRVKVAMASCELSGLPYWLDTTPALTVNGIVARSRIMAMRVGVKMILVDYLQLIAASMRRGESMEQVISDQVRTLKNLARELNVPVVLISQLRRPPIGSRDPEPTMQELKGSGGIESHADVVLLLHRPRFNEIAREHAKTDTAELIIGKQRNGPLGKVRVTLDLDHVRFLNQAPERLTRDEEVCEELL